MSSRNIRIVFALAVVIAALAVYSQYQWIKKGIELSDRDFDRRVKYALYQAGHYLLLSNHRDYNGSEDLVEKISPSYYIVKVNDHINYVSLKQLLSRELNSQDVITTYEFGIYDCETDKMQLGERVNMAIPGDTLTKPTDFPKQKKINYYFGVNFPERTTYLNSQLGNVKWSTAILFSLLGILAYIIFIIFKQKRLQEIQKDFVNNMTHEFKTPLSTIQIASEVLKNPNIVNNPERLLNYATIIGNETTQLTNQVERVLQMASTEKGEIILKKSEFDMNEIITELVNKYRPLIRSKGGGIQQNTLPQALMLSADRLHIRNLVSNLIDNAIKYCDGEPQISLSALPKNSGIELRVKDNGIGIAPEHVKNVFNKFYRVPTGNIHNVKGFGLGLSYVKLIAKRHGGQVVCNSELGKGTEFVIFIPN
jgi:two-component system, OmpR family, phosphate regulon sensor histidine kinase PhoR